jgi:hypothetical protein
MRDVFVWWARCSNCNKQIELPDATFLLHPDRRGEQPKEPTPRLLACPLCKHVSIQDHFDPPGRSQIEMSATIAHQVRVPCAQAGCEEYLIVIGLLAPKDDVKEVTRDWIFDETVRCPKGHPFHPLSNCESENSQLRMIATGV